MFDPFAGPAIERTVTTTPAQREIWASSLMGSDASLAYNEAILLRLRGQLDTGALEAALTTLVARHESLRASFSPDGMSMMVMEPAAPVIERHDWRSHGESERDRELAALGERLVTTPFVLEQGPLVRFDLAALGPADYALFISAHHVVCDGWSFGVIVQNLATLYEASRQQREPQLPPAELFSDYATSLNTSELLTGRTSHDAYWLAEFQSVPDPLELPTTQSRSSSRSYSSHRVDVMLPIDLTSGLRQLGARNGCSLFVTLLAGYSALISRLSQQDDLVVGVASAGQALAGRDELVGHCVNTLPIRLRPSATLPFADWMLKVRSTYLDAFEHQELGLGRLLERIAFRRSPGRAPLVSLMFNLDRVLPSSALAFSELAVTMQSVPRRAENFELFLNILESPDGLSLECQYNTDLFDEATVRRWLKTYELLLRAAVAEPRTTLSRLPVLTSEDRDVLAQCNNSTRVWSDGGVVHALIEARAAQHPGRAAVEQDGATLSYGELNARANQLARHLRTVGVTRGAFVGLALARTPDLLVGVLGVLKAGAAYVPLDPSLPAARLAGMSVDAELSAIVTQSAAGLAVDIPAPVSISLDLDASTLAATSPYDLPGDEHSARPSDPAYVIFTSGSTGKPKGVVVPHSALVNLLLSVQETPGMSADDVVLAITTLGFDIAVSELLLPLTVGARIVLASRETATDGVLLRALIESRRVTFIDATPASYRMLLAAGWTGSSRLRIICTGEAMPRELAVTLLDCAREVWNGYGPTETTVWSTFYRVQSPIERVLIGRPVANTLVSIRDTNGESVPVGVAGELFIGGDGVATGYLNRPELTSERFTHDAHVPGLRWYRTGDLVRLLPNAELECLGRADDQVKIRGYRIEPGEIAVAVSGWPGVQQATVIARQDQPHDVRLVAYVVADADTIFGESFRAHLKESLPDYMIPSAIVRVPVMPLNASGKIDRKQLPAPDASSLASADAYMAPRTETEHLLAGLWQQALAMARVGVRDDFFALGGHSLLASQILARLRSDHGIHLTFRRIFEAPTIEALARIIDTERSTGTPAPPIDRILHRAGATTARLSALQERIWMLNELDPASQPAYNHAASWHLNGQLDEAAIEQALHAVMRRQAMLRTSFHTENGERKQTVHDRVSFALERVDLRHVALEQRDAAIESYFAEQQQIPFDIGVAPLFRASLIALGNDQHLLYTLQNGLIWDGWSFDIFLRDLSAQYEAIVKRIAPSMEELPVSYGDFAEWQRAWLSGPEADQQRAWWDSHLAGAHEALALPIDYPRRADRAIEGAHVKLNFDKHELANVQSLARQYDSTLFMVMLAAYNVWLHFLCDQESVLVASPMRARVRPELESLIGPFVNTMVFRTNITPSATFGDVLRSVRDSTLDALTHQALPFEELNSTLPPIRALFSLQDVRDRPQVMGALAVEQRHVPAHFATNDLTMWMMHYPERLLAVFNYSTGLLKPETAQGFLSSFRAIVAALCASPDRPIASLDLVPWQEGETARRLPAAPSAPSVLALIHRAALDRPQSDAIVCGSARATYESLWRRAEHASMALTAKGIRSGDVVAVDLPSGIDRAITTLAVLRTGAVVLDLQADDAAEYSARVCEAVPSGTRLRIRSRSGGSQNGDAVATLAELEAIGAAESTKLPPFGGGMLSALPASGSAFSWVTCTAPQLDAQAQALREALTAGVESKVLLALAAGTDGWVQGLLATLSASATACLVDEDVITSAMELADEAARMQCTAQIGTAATWRMTGSPTATIGAFASGVVIGGGLDSKELRAIIQGGTKVSVTFGVGEFGAIAAVHSVGPAADHSLVGQAIDGVALRVFDRNGRVVPVGMSGGLWAARAGDNAHWVATRLSARRTTSGEIQVLTAQQPLLWLNGSLVDSAIIESAIQQLPGIQLGAIAEHRDRDGRPWIVAYVEFARADAADSNNASLQALLRSRLPAVWLPKRTVIMHPLPRDSKGEVDRGALRSPFVAAEKLRVEEPTSADEVLMSGVWAEVLGVGSLGRQHNFFKLGGTSLMCFQVVELVRARTKVRISPRTLLLGSLADAAAELARLRAPSSR